MKHDNKYDSYDYDYNKYDDNCDHVDSHSKIENNIVMKQYDSDSCKKEVDNILYNYIVITTNKVVPYLSEKSVLFICHVIDKLQVIGTEKIDDFFDNLRKK